MKRFFAIVLLGILAALDSHAVGYYQNFIVTFTAPSDFPTNGTVRFTGYDSYGGTWVAQSRSMSPGQSCSVQMASHYVQDYDLPKSVSYRSYAALASAPYTDYGSDIGTITWEVGNNTMVCLLGELSPGGGDEGDVTNTNLPPILYPIPETPEIIITNIQPELPTNPVYNPPGYDPNPPVSTNPIVIVPEVPELPLPIITNIIINPPEIVITNESPDIDDLLDRLDQLIAKMEDGGYGDGTGGSDGSGGTNGTSGGNVFIEGMNPGVYGSLTLGTAAGTETALENRHLSSEEIALRIHDVLANLGISGESMKVRVQESLNDQGLSDYKIGIAVQDALYQMGTTSEGIAKSVEWGLSQRHLSAEQVALEIQAALQEIGLDTSGMANSMQAALQNQDVSAYNFQMAFEAGLNNQGMSAENIGTASEIALANRNLSAGEIGQEVGNQIHGLGLSTQANDDENTQSIVDAINGINIPSNNNSDVVSAIESLGEGTGNTVDGTLVAGFNTNSVFSTNSIVSEMSSFNQTMNEQIGLGSAWVQSLFTFNPPAIGKSYSMTIDFNGFSSSALDLDIPIYNLDLSHPAIARFRAVEVFCLWVVVALACAKILKDTFAA